MHRMYLIILTEISFPVVFSLSESLIADFLFSLAFFEFLFQNEKKSFSKVIYCGKIKKSNPKLNQTFFFAL